MLNKIWAIMILIGTLFSLCTGQLDTLTDAILDSAKEAISLCIATAGAMSMWMGLMEIAKDSGLLEKMTRMVGPLLDLCFPRIPKTHKAREYIATNIVANVLGLGWACTPAGLKAMKELCKLEKERGNPEYQDEENESYDGEEAMEESRRALEKREKSAGPRTASKEMCTFLILNISSLQLIPVNMIAYRQEYGSKEPTSIIGPVIIATLASTLVSILYCKWKERRVF